MPVLLLFFRQVKPALWKAPLAGFFFSFRRGGHSSISIAESTYALAVSVRIIRLPSPASGSPRSDASAVSESESPPSGPIRKPMLSGRLPSIIPRRGRVPSPSQHIKPSPQAASSATASRQLISPHTGGTDARPHCAAADSLIRFSRSSRLAKDFPSGRATQRSLITATMRVAPSSTARRTKSSVFSPFGRH